MTAPREDVVARSRQLRAANVRLALRRGTSPRRASAACFLVVPLRSCVSLSVTLRRRWHRGRRTFGSYTGYAGAWPRSFAGISTSWRRGRRWGRCLRWLLRRWFWRFLAHPFHLSAYNMRVLVQSRPERHTLEVTRDRGCDSPLLGIVSRVRPVRRIGRLSRKLPMSCSSPCRQRASTSEQSCDQLSCPVLASPDVQRKRSGPPMKAVSKLAIAVTPVVTQSRFAKAIIIAARNPTTVTQVFAKRIRLS